MTDLKITPVFQDIKCNFGDQVFSAMYFGRHCGKNLLVLKHDVTLMLVFRDNEWSTPEFIKPISFRENPAKGIQIVGNEDDIILMMDECGSLWRLSNAFDLSVEKHECLHTLKDNCFYEWVPYKKFNFVKVLALTTFGRGFACLGVRQNLKKKLTILASMNTVLEDFTFEELNTTDSLNYYLVNLNINILNSVFKTKLGPSALTEETLLVSDRLSGKTYLCTKSGRCLINQSNVFLICALHFLQEKCIALCFENGKIVFHFYNESRSNCTVHLPRKLVFVEKCCCFDSCILWSDGVNLQHTKLTFVRNQPLVKQKHLKLCCAIERPLSILRIFHYAITVTVNNIYYSVSPGQNEAVQIKRHPKELLFQISKYSSDIDKLQLKTDMFSHYLYCKDIIQKNKAKEKIEMRCEGNLLAIKNSLGVCLRQKFWRVRMKASYMNKELVHMISLEYDVSEGMFITIENPFRDKGMVSVSLVGNFDGKVLFFELGVLGKSGSIDLDKNSLSEHLKKILRQRNSFYVKK